LGVGDEGGGGVEAHRLVVDHPDQEHRRPVALHPAGGGGDEREGEAVREGEPVSAEALDLGVEIVGSLLVDAEPVQAVEEALAQGEDSGQGAFGAHGAAEPVGFGRGESGAVDGEHHGLFLEQDGAEGDGEEVVDDRVDGGDGVFAGATAEVFSAGSGGAGAGADERDLDREVLEGAGLHDRGDAGLRPRFDLEDSDGVPVVDHVVDARVVGGDVGELHRRTRLAEHRQDVGDRGEGPEREQVVFDQARVDGGFLISLDDAAAGHPGPFDGEDFADGAFA
jgi:hypothetical protein